MFSFVFRIPLILLGKVQTVGVKGRQTLEGGRAVRSAALACVTASVKGHRLFQGLFYSF